PDGHEPQWLFTENETNVAKLFGASNANPFVKDAFHEFLIHGRNDAVNPKELGTKASAYHVLNIPARGEAVVQLRLFRSAETSAPTTPKERHFGWAFAPILANRIREAEEFYAPRQPETCPAQERQVARQAYAGLIWSKQFYHYVVKHWRAGDANEPAPPA